MKILFEHPDPFFLAHGGFQTQIERSKDALEKLGVNVEFLRWWDPQQRGDLIHFFGLPHPSQPRLAAQKNMRFVVSHLLGGLGARAPWKRSLQKLLIGAALKTLPESALDRIGWSVWHLADAYIAVTSWEARLMREVFRVDPERLHIVPNGVDDIFFDRHDESRDKWLVTVASIFPVKRVLEMARAAVRAQTPFKIFGRPLSKFDPYYLSLLELCRRHSGLLDYDEVQRTHEQLAQIYWISRGFVLLSRWESQSLSALEAAAARCPLLLSDLPWARATFGKDASYCRITGESETAECLKRFYESAPSTASHLQPARWSDVGQMLKTVYESALTR